MILRARTIVPVSRPAIDDGVVCIAGDRIQWIGPHADLPGTYRGEPQTDLGEVVLMPGLVNAHCHLDYTAMAGQIVPPKSFADWIKAIVALKGGWKTEEFAASWKSGAEMLLRTGTTTVADIEAVPELLPSAWDATRLRVISFRELIQIKARPDPSELIERAVNDWLGVTSAQGRVGLSPHAPYTTSAQLLEQAARAAHRRHWRLTTHVAESEQEFEMFMYKHGPLFDWLKHQRDMSDCGLGSPVQHLERCGYLDESLLAVHVNYLWRHDAGLLGRNHVSVAHCPRSHDYFRHLKFPREELENAGVNICLGTDSLATVRPDRGQPLELNMFAEMQMLASKAPALSPERILAMATVNGAAALGRKGQIGELAPDALADLIVLPLVARTDELFESIVRFPGNVLGSMIGGTWVLPPPSSQS